MKIDSCSRNCKLKTDKIGSFYADYRDFWTSVFLPTKVSIYVVITINVYCFTNHFIPLSQDGKVFVKTQARRPAMMPKSIHKISGIEIFEGYVV